MSRLCERDDFSELVGQTANQLGIGNPAIVEKDYYVTEALRIIAGCFGDRVLFKGGTSLSKGWKLLDRFSEDIDLYVQEDRSSSRATNRLLKCIALAVAERPLLSRNVSRTRYGLFGHEDYFEYGSRAAYLQGIDLMNVLVEPMRVLMSEVLAAPIRGNALFGDEDMRAATVLLRMAMP